MVQPVDIFSYGRTGGEKGSVSDPTTNPVDDFFKQKRNAETALHLVDTSDPARTARANIIARETKIPAPAIEDSLDLVEAQKNAERMVGLMNQYGAIGRWGSDKRNASVAVDDTENIGLIASLWEGTKDFVTGVPAALETGAVGGGQMGDDLFQGLDRFNRTLTYPLRGGLSTVENALFGTNVFDPDANQKRSETAFKQRQQGRNAYQDVSRPQSENWVAQNLLAGVESVPLTLAAVATRSPGGGTALIGSLVGAGEYQRGLDEGLSGIDALRFGATQGFIEYTTEKLPVGKLINDIANKTPFAKTFVNQLAREIPGEQAATFLQDMTEWGTLNPDKTVAEFIAERPEAAQQTALATIGGVGTTTAISTAADRTISSGLKLADKVADSQSAKQSGEFIDRLGKAMEKSKLLARDPVAFKEMIKGLAEDNAVSEVFIPGEQLQEYQQSDGYNPDGREAEWLSGYEVDESAAIGGDVVVPVEELSAIAGTSLFERMKEHMRFTAGGMSQAEAQTFDDAMADVMDELAESAAVEQEELGARDTLNQSITDKLMNAGFTPVIARQQSELLTQRYATRASRLGKDLTGQEFDDIAVNQILPESLATAQKLDDLDIVINALKKRVEGTEKRTSLLEWIASKGGIEDRGGDLKAMGADKWHRGKAFRKKLLRSFDPDQPSLLGSDGQQNSNSPDELALRAWEAGFFPEFSERPSVNDLQAAIAEGIAGRERYAEDAANDNIRLAADELAAILNKMGLDETAPKKDIESALAQYSQQSEGRGFDQSFSDGPRGRITFPESGFQGTATIDLFAKRDMSTLLHETGHLWLEELRFDNTDPDAPKQLKDDFKAIEKWFKSNGHAIKDGVIPVEAHEMWARGVERYLMEGKSPVRALNGIFESFKGWLISIYKTVEALRSPISPEIREVMDRLIATDAEISEAREAQSLDALFTDADEAGMTGKEFEAYTKLTADARSAAHNSLIDKTMRSVRHKAKKEYKSQSDALRPEATESVDARREFRALAAVSDTPIETEWVKEVFGQDSLQLLPRRVPPIHKKGGADPDHLAERTGFQTGEEMVQTLMGLEATRVKLKEGGDKRPVRTVAIQQEIDAIIESRFGNPLNDGTIEQEALAAVHNDAQGEVISAEIRVLGRRTGQRATPYSLAKQWARGKIRGGEVRIEASRSAIQRYKRAAERASKSAQKAMLSRDFDEVFRHKQSQMVNNALVSEAKAALDEVEKAVNRLGKIAKKKTIKSVDQDYLEQAHSLLENVDIRQRSQVSIDKAGQFNEWAKAQTEDGFDVVVPDTFEAMIGKTNWSRLSVENLLGLDDAVKQIIHLGRLKQGLIDNKERREFDDLVSDAVEGMGNLKKKPPTDMTEPTKWDRFKSGVANIDASLLKMETVFDWLDGSGDGVFNRIAFQPIAEAQNNERLLLNEHINKLQGLLAAMPKEDIRRWSRKVKLDLIDRATGEPVSVTHDQLISMALNMGNEGNAKKLAGGYGWTEQGVMVALNEHLSEADWRYVQNVWDAIDTLWPQIEALEKRLNGVAPEKIAARPVQTAFGQLKGGYFPVVYDPARDYQTEKQQAGSGDKLFENTYTRATTSKGFTKERTQVERPIHLSLGVINRHVAEVIHDITHREAVMQAYKFLNSTRIKRAVDNTLGPEIRKQFNPWLQHVANEWAMDRAGLIGLEGFLTKMRTNTTVVGMGYRYTTMIMQLAGFNNSFERVGLKHVAPHIKDLLSKEKIDFVLDKSLEVRARMETLDRDIRDNMKAAMGRDYHASGMLKYIPAEIAKLPDDVKRFAFHGIGWMDRVVVIPTWLGEYNKQLDAGKTEDQAIHLADKAVRQSQGAGGAKDLASVQRGRGASGAALKLLTQFYSYMSGFYQRQRTFGRDTGEAVRTRDMSKFPELLARSFWIFVAAPVMAELLSDRGPEEDEDAGMWTFQMMLFHMFGPIPIFRDFGPEAIKAATDQKTYGYQFTPATSGIETAVNVARDVGNVVEGDDTKRMTRNVLELGGYATGKFTGQMATSVQFFVDVGYGEQDPENVSEWWEGVTKGKVKD